MDTLSKLMQDVEAAASGLSEAESNRDAFLEPILKALGATGGGMAIFQAVNPIATATEFASPYSSLTPPPRIGRSSNCQKGMHFTWPEYLRCLLVDYCRATSIGHEAEIEQKAQRIAALEAQVVATSGALADFVSVWESYCNGTQVRTEVNERVLEVTVGQSWKKAKGILVSTPAAALANWRVVVAAGEQMKAAIRQALDSKYRFDKTNVINYAAVRDPLNESAESWTKARADLGVKNV